MTSDPEVRRALGRDLFEVRRAIGTERDAAFRAAARIEGRLRFAISCAVYAAGIAAVASRWSILDAPSLFVIIVGVAVLRAVGNGVLAVWSHREVARIKARLPMGR